MMDVNTLLSDARSGWQAGEMLTTEYARQPNPQPQYICGRRVHHGDIGVIGTILTALIGGVAYAYMKDENDKELILRAMSVCFGFCGQLVWDDRADYKEWLTFKEKDKSAPFQQPTDYPVQYNSIRTTPYL